MKNVTLNIDWANITEEPTVYVLFLRVRNPRERGEGHQAPKENEPSKAI